MKLTKRQREILQALRDGEDLVEEGRECWCGLSRTSVATILFFLRRALIEQTSGKSQTTLKRYEITSFGQLALDDPSFEPMEFLL